MTKMRHNREEVIDRLVREYEELDKLIANLTDEEWQKPVPRPESKDPWTVKDSIAHIIYWKADAVRRARKLPKPPEDRGLDVDEGNHKIYMEWRDRSPQEVLEWHRQVQQDALEALKAAPDEYFSAKERNPKWPYDLDGHSGFHRLRDVEKALKGENRYKQSS